MALPHQARPEPTVERKPPIADGIHAVCTYDCCNRDKSGVIFNLAGMADGMVTIDLHRSFMVVANYLGLSVPGKVLAFFRMVSGANTTSGLAVRRSFKCC